jgi:hypothetical protein
MTAAFTTQMPTLWEGAITSTVDVMSGFGAAMVSDGLLASTILGNDPIVDAFACSPTSPASLSVSVSAGVAWKVTPLLGTALGSIPADTAHSVPKAYWSPDAVSLTLAPPTTAGYSQSWLVQAAPSEADSDFNILSFFNSSNWQVPFSGPAGSGTSSATRRTRTLAIELVPGASAPTGSQTAPAPTAGCIPLFVITLANGQTTITSSSIQTHPSAPFLAMKLPAMSKASRKTQSWWDPVVDFGADPTGTNDSTAALNSFWAAMVATGIPGRMPAGTFKVSGAQLIWDLALVANNGITLTGAGNGQTIIDVSACTGSPQHLVQCSATGGAAFYSSFLGFGIKGSTTGIVSSFGRDWTGTAFPDCLNSCMVDVNVWNNHAGSTCGSAVRFNYMVNSLIDTVANCSGMGNGTAIENGGLVGTDLSGSGGNAHIGLHIIATANTDGLDLSKIDLEAVDIPYQSDSSYAGAVTIHGGKLVRNNPGFPTFQMNAAGGQVLLLGGSPGTGGFTVAGAMAGNVCIVGRGIGTLRLGGLDINPDSGDAALNLWAATGTSAEIVAKTDAGIIQYAWGCDTAWNWFVDLKNPTTGVQVVRPIQISQSTGGVKFTGPIGFSGNTPIVQPSVGATSRGGSAGSAPTDLATALTAIARLQGMVTAMQTLQDNTLTNLDALGLQTNNSVV